MDATIERLRTCASWGKAKRLAAVAVYEDSPTEERVNGFCQTLSRSLGQGCELRKEMWLLNELRMPQLRGIAAGEAAGADLLIVSIHHAEGVPAELKDWVGLWAAKKGHRKAVLLGLLDPVYQGDSGAVRGFLQQVAKKANVEFLVVSEEKPEDD